MKSRYLKMAALAAGVVLVSACSQAVSGPPAPNFYPNAKYQQVGPTQAQQDTQYCSHLADEYVKDPNRFKEGAINTAEVAAAGAAAGAIGGVIMKGKVGRATAAGAATGAIIQVLREAQKAGDKSPSWHKFVEKCLEEKGYQVYGWQ